MYVYHLSVCSTQTYIDVHLSFCLTETYIDIQFIQTFIDIFHVSLRLCVCASSFLRESLPLSLTFYLPCFTHNNISSYSCISPAAEICTLIIFIETEMISLHFFICDYLTMERAGERETHCSSITVASSSMGGSNQSVCFLILSKQVMALHNQGSAGLPLSWEQVEAVFIFEI